MHAIVAEEEPYWTDGYTSLSQNEVNNLLYSDAGAKQWGGKGGLSQIDADADSDSEGIKNIMDATAEKVKAAVHEVSDVLTSGARKLKEVGGIAIDKAMTAVTPSKEHVAMFLNANSKVKELANEISAKSVNVSRTAGLFLQNKVAPVAEVVAVLELIPFLKTGFKTAGAIADLVRAGSVGSGKILTALTAPDDGTPKSCWIKSKLRKFSMGNMARTCTEAEYPTSGKGGICYQVCPDGVNGIGPVCWGQCNPDVHAGGCGPLCLIKSEKTKCKDVIKKVTTEAISTGVSAASGDFLGAIFGGMAIAGNLAYPICKSFH